MASFKELTKEQKCAVYIFLEEYSKIIPLRKSYWIDPFAFSIRFGVGIDTINEYRKSIGEEDNFSHAICILKGVDNKRLFMYLLDDCYLMLQDILQSVDSNKYLEEYTKLRNLFKREFDYNSIPISEVLP